jgi:hypothetical protein
MRVISVTNLGWRFFEGQSYQVPVVVWFGVTVDVVIKGVLVLAMTLRIQFAESEFSGESCAHWL